MNKIFTKSLTTVLAVILTTLFLSPISSSASTPPSNNSSKFEFVGGVSKDIRPDSNRVKLNSQEKAFLTYANSLKKYLPNQGKGVNIIILINDAPTILEPEKCNLELFASMNKATLLTFMKVAYARVLQCRTVKGDWTKYYMSHEGYINSEGIASAVAIKLGAKNVTTFDPITSEQFHEADLLLKNKNK